MKSVPKLIRRFVSILLFSFTVLVILNLAVLTMIVLNQSPNSYPWKTAQETAGALKPAEDGYTLSTEISEELKSSDIWGIFIDNDTLQVVWQTDNLPETVPHKYTVSDIASLTRGYIDGYPTFTGETEHGLLVMGYPKNSFWKHMWPSWDYQMISGFPKIILAVLAANIGALLLIYICANTKLLHSVKPIADGIQSLPTGKPVYIRENGLLSELAANINKTSEVLQSQSYQLRKKETARANWIAGVSHDIRTPLSMIMGYAGQLENDICLTEEARKNARVIIKNSQKMRDLINDLNLASKLEYNMQPIKPRAVNAISVVRQVVVDFINTDIDEKHPIEWEIEDKLSACTLHGNRDLLKRAVSNLIQNCISHNENGCRIYVSAEADEKNFVITIEDDGIGISDEKIKELNIAPHYMFCDSNILEQRHGLGLLIVRQITASHNGQFVIGHSVHGGFCAKLVLPMKQGGQI